MCLRPRRKRRLTRAEIRERGEQQTADSNNSGAPMRANVNIDTRQLAASSGESFFAAGGAGQARLERPLWQSACGAAAATAPHSAV
jgi:hypothetical protein